MPSNNIMNEPSEEQQNIIEHIKNEYNVYVEAVAGSGKSTTVLSMANQLSDKKILQLTYNSSLRLEIKAKTTELNIDNIIIHTFHSLAVKYFNHDAHTDTGIRHVLLNKMEPKLELPHVDILVIDENQDFTELYFQLVIKFVLLLKSKVQIICLGDSRQCIYEFKGADPRFLTFADKIWTQAIFLKRPEFIKCYLKTSYRITNQMGHFVNKALIGDDLMLTCRDGEPVTYIRNNYKNVENLILYNIKNLMSSGVKPDEIFVLAASVKGINSYVRKMENRLVEENVPIHVPIFETEKLDDRVISGKIVFSTFHSVKGRQRPYVFVLGFDNNYFMHYARTLPKNECPNTLYVGCTRAIKGLFLVEYDQHISDRPLEFLKMKHGELMRCEFVNFKGLPRSIFHKMKDVIDMAGEIQTRYENPSKMVQFIPDYVLNKITPIIDKIFVNHTDNMEIIELPHITETKYGYEDVSDLNGIAIPCYFYDKISKQNVLHKMINGALSDVKANDHGYLRKIVNELPQQCEGETIDTYLYLANVYVALSERLYFKLKQIPRNQYNWLKQEDLDRCVERLEKIVYEPNIEFEKVIIHYSNDTIHEKIDKILFEYIPNIRFRFCAIIDVLTENTIWELKCTKQLSIEHKLQILIYAWIYEAIHDKKMVYKLYNVKTNELYVLNYDFEELTNVVVCILKGKYETPQILSDGNFVKTMNGILNNMTIDYLTESTLKFMDTYA